jgi:uncharacterized protein (DUF433 family)
MGAKLIPWLMDSKLRVWKWKISVKLMTAANDVKVTADGLVVSNPGILGGTPVFRGTRLPVQTLFDYLADGLSLEYFLDSFDGIKREDAQRVLRYGWGRIASEVAR